jgi:hypothetical protein
MGEEAGQGEGARYAAFISYSHRDAAFGRRLHRRLEGYGIPRRLVGRPTPAGPVPRRLAPIFRDRDELPAAGDLTREVREALRASRALVVVCSPAAAASPWVAKEVREFRRLHPDRPILAALIAGEPADAFPEPLRRSRREPVAADFRKGGDGAALGRLKLVAGLTGLGLDELVQRDAQRQRAGVMAVTAGSLAAVLAMGALTTFAITARLAAERERRQSEALVEFMLTDLRDKLRSVGRLDVMTDVNRRALAYYDRADGGPLSATSLEKRARVLQAMGEDSLTRRDMAAAHARFAEAERTTQALLAEKPDDPERVFAQAQSDYWRAYTDYVRGDVAAARRGFDVYRQRVERLAAMAPDAPRYRKELAYGEGTICAAALDEPVDVRGALTHCSAALAAMQAIAAQRPDDVKAQSDLANRHAWLADAYREAGDLGHALAHRRAEGRILEGLMAADPHNLDRRTAWLGQQRALAGLEGLTGNRRAAMTRLRRARETLDPMIAGDRENAEWKALRERIDATITYFEKTSTARASRG